MMFGYNDPREEAVRCRVEPCGHIEEFVMISSFTAIMQLHILCENFPNWRSWISTQIAAHNRFKILQIMDYLYHWIWWSSFFKFIVRILKYNYGNIRLATYAEGQNNAIPFITQLLEKDGSNLFTNATLNIIYQEATFKWNNEMEPLTGIHNNKKVRHFSQQQQPQRNNTTISLTFTAKSGSNLPHATMLQKRGKITRHLFSVISMWKPANWPWNQMDSFWIIC